MDITLRKYLRIEGGYVLIAYPIAKLIPVQRGTLIAFLMHASTASTPGNSIFYLSLAFAWAREQGFVLKWVEKPATEHQYHQWTDILGKSILETSEEDLPEVKKILGSE